MITPGSGEELGDALAAGGAPRALAPAVAGTLGPGAAAALGEDPWRLLAVPGVRPDQADAYARSRLGAHARPDDLRRARAIVGWLLRLAARDGHTAVPAATIRRALPAFGFADAEGTLAAVVADGGVVAVDGAGGPDGGADGVADGGDGGAGGAAGASEHPLLLALEPWATAEAGLAEGVERLLTRARHLCGPDQAASAAGGDDRPAEATGTVEAVRAAATSGVSVAAPETPAATPMLVGALGRLAEATGRRLVVAAATIRATRLLRGCTGAVVTTTRELIETGGEVPGDIVVVTESAVLDVASAAALVAALADGTHLVLAGDPAGLASPGPGRVLAELAESGAVPVTQVTVGNGSGAGSGAGLARLAASVRAGTLPQVDPAARDVVIVPARDAAEATHRAVQLVSDSIPRAVGVPVEDVLVVTPRRSGAAGADAVNAACKRRLNPGPGKYAGFDPGDRVVVATATFPGAPYGEVGHVAGTSEAGLDLDFSSRRVSAAPDAVGALRLGWAVTARQAPVSSWPAVVAVFPGEAAGSLTRALVLSTISTARSHLSVVHGAGRALAHAVARAHHRSRVTQRLPLGRVG